jgi:hypothetical protein
MIFFERSNKNIPNAQLPKRDSTTYEEIINTNTQGDRLFLVRKDNKPVSIVVITTPHKIKELNRYGINIPGSNALTSQVTATLGLYRQTLVKRFYQNEEITPYAKAKKDLIKIAQTRIDYLCPLEQLINHPHCKFDDLNNTLNAYVGELEKYKGHLKNILNETQISNYDSQILENLEKQIDRDIQETKNYLKKILDKDISRFLLAYGPDSLQSFIKQRLISIVRQTQQCNQNIAYCAGAITRGSLHGHCEQSIVQIQQSNDLHNRVLPEHQCYFSQPGKQVSEKPEKQALEFSIYDTNLLMCLCAIDDQLNPSATSVSKTWRSRFKNLLHWLYERSVCLFVEYIFDFPLGVLSGFFSFDATSISKKITLRSPWDEEKNYGKRLKELALPKTSALLQLGQYLGRFLRDTLLNSFRATKAFIYEITVQLVESLKGDYYSGHLQRLKEKELYDSLKKVFDKLLKDPTDRSLFEQQSFQPNETEKYSFARSAYELNPVPYNDILNLCASRLTLVFDHINSIPRNHPFSGLVLMLFYISALAYLFAPGLLHSLLGLSAAHSIAPQTLNYPNFIAYLFLNFTVRTSLSSLNDRPDSALASGLISLVLMLGLSYIFWAGEKVLHTLPWNPNQPLPPFSAGLYLTRCLALDQNNALQVSNTRENKGDEPKQNDLLNLLLMYQPLLHQLSEQQKRDVRRWIKQTHPELLHTINQWFEPQSSSALVTTLILIAKHLTLLLRCFCTPITWTAQPFIELRDLLIQDAARIIHATFLVLHSVINTLGTILRAMGDFVGNGVFARMHALVSKQHTCSKKTYGYSEKTDHIWESMTQLLQSLFGRLRKETTTPHPWTVYYKYNPGLFTQTDQIKTTNCMAEAETARYVADAVNFGA